MKWIRGCNGLHSAGLQDGALVYAASLSGGPTMNHYFRESILRPGQGKANMGRAAVWAGLIAMLLISFYARAQNIVGSQVNGTITDSSGALVIGAEITVTGTATGVAYHAVSDNLGAYHVTNLPPG